MVEADVLFLAEKVALPVQTVPVFQQRLQRQQLHYHIMDVLEAAKAIYLLCSRRSFDDRRRKPDLLLVRYTASSVMVHLQALLAPAE